MFKWFLAVTRPNKQKKTNEEERGLGLDTKQTHIRDPFENEKNRFRHWAHFDESSSFSVWLALGNGGEPNMIVKKKFLIMKIKKKKKEFWYSILSYKMIRGLDATDIVLLHNWFKPSSQATKLTGERTGAGWHLAP